MRMNQAIANLLPDPKNFELSDGGKNAGLFLLRNNAGLTAAIANFGARLVSLVVLDKSHQPLNVVLGFDNILGYRQRPGSYFGATIGRYAGRISRGEFKIDGRIINVDRNESGNCLHGGYNGFDLKLFDVDEVGADRITMRLLSKDGECGFPGNLNLKVTYTLTEDKGLEICYEAVTDRSTVINLTNHSYFNLNGRGNGNILDHLLQINSDFFLPVDSGALPTGKIEPVEGTPFDFRKAMTIGSRINDDNLQLKHGKGYNHSFVSGNDVQNTPVMRVTGERSGIIMETFTNEPAVHFYSGNEMEPSAGPPENPWGPRSGFAIETQHFPDSPNQPDFPSTLLTPGQNFTSRTWYKLSCE